MLIVLSKLLCLLTFGTPQLEEPVQQVREQFLAAELDEAKVKALHATLQSKDDSSQPLIVGYHGIVEAMLANWGWDPFARYRHFQNGKALLEDAILRDPANPELRCLRFLVQSNAPRFLGYHKNRQEDARAIVNSIEYAKNHPGYVDLLKKVSVNVIALDNGPGKSELQAYLAEQNERQ